MQNYKLKREVKNIVEWEKPFKKAKVRTGLWCLLVVVVVIVVVVVVDVKIIIIMTISTFHWCSVACVTDRVVKY
jgi:hypothetical protein